MENHKSVNFREERRENMRANSERTEKGIYERFEICFMNTNDFK